MRIRSTSIGRTGRSACANTSGRHGCGAISSAPRSGVPRSKAVLGIGGVERAKEQLLVALAQHALDRLAIGTRTLGEERCDAAPLAQRFGAQRRTLGSCEQLLAHEVCLDLLFDRVRCDVRQRAVDHTHQPPALAAYAAQNARAALVGQGGHGARGLGIEIDRAAHGRSWARSDRPHSFSRAA